MTYTGIYINLDRSTERRAVMEDQLTRLGLQDRYARFSAVDGNQLGLRTSLTDSQIGCFTSHHRAQAFFGVGSMVIFAVRVASACHSGDAR